MAAVASTPNEVVALHRSAIAAARAVVPGREPPYFALLRVVTGDRVRDVLLGRRSQMIGDLALVDWERSPLAEVFFSHYEGDEYSIDVDRRALHGRVVLRHLVEFDGDEPCRIERESGTICHGPAGWIEVPTVRPVLAPRGDRQLSPGDAVMLDPVQRAAVELAASRPLLVLGEAGFGKTTVALHRIASVAARAAAQGRPFRGLVIVPSEALRRLSVLTLERLGTTTLEVETFEQWIVAQARRVFVDLPRRLSRNASPVVSRLKRHPALREVLPDIVAGTPAMRAIGRGYHESKGSREALLHLFGDRDLLARVVEASTGALGQSAITACVAHTRLQFTSTTEERYAHVDAERLATLDGRAIDDGTPMQDAGTIDVEDCAVLLELRHRAGDKAPASARYDHIVVDEAQELAPIELGALGRALAQGAAPTVAGDDAQQIDETVAFVGWPAVMTEIGAARHERVTLASSYRCPANVERLARLVVGRGGGESTPRSDRLQDWAPIVWHRVPSPCHLVSHTAMALTELRERDRRARIAIVCRHHESAERLYRQLERGFPVRLALDGDFDFMPGAIVTCVEEVRGLEFDHVIVPDASPGSYPEDPAARRALYVAMTRTMHQLWLVTPSVWSPLLRAHVGLGAAADP